ncbi:MAG: hypothetical protein LBP61_09305 [Desulfovibrio sp.]|nr:hypothetical protein [Desulfovibrio sp.]
MIASFIDGRVRIRAGALKQAGNMAAAKSLVEAGPGVLKVEGNLRTGSLLVYYDPAILPRETLLGAASLLEERFGDARRGGGAKIAPRPFSRETEIFLLFLSYGGTLAGLLLDRRLHVLSGLAFSLLTGLHVCARRRKGV